MPVLLENVDTLVFSSRLLSDQVSSEVPASKRAVVHNTVDEEVRCSKVEVQAKIKQKMGREVFRILFLSNMVPSKGYADVIKAVDQLQSRQPQIPLHLDLVGDWPDETGRDRLEDRLLEDGLTDHVTVHGRVVEREKVRTFFLNADAFVLPTYYPNEAQPFSIIEAMNAGTPIIATPHASIPEYVTDDHNGYLVSQRAPSEIAQAIERLCDREEWTRKAHAARKTYEECFSPESVRDQLFEALSLTD
jgi:glycosyltransferase involved in cell wall biosynthesis